MTVVDDLVVSNIFPLRLSSDQKKKSAVVLVNVTETIASFTLLQVSSAEASWDMLQFENLHAELSIECWAEFNLGIGREMRSASRSSLDS